MFRAVVVVAVALAVVSCAHSPRLSRQSEDVTTLRAEYLNNYPDDEFKQQIINGEVRKGMNIFQVLASWGLPNVRRGVTRGTSESWIYYAVDEHTQKLMSYELVFQKRSLSYWIIDGDVPGLGTLTPRDLIGIPTIGESPGPDPAKASESSTLKKKP